MKQKLFWAIAILVFVVGAGSAFAGETKCKNPEGFYDFPNGWTVAWEKKIPLQIRDIAMDALIVREYRFRDGAIALYYRAVYPGYLRAEAVEIVNGEFSEDRFFFRHLYAGSCWREVKEFNLAAHINTVTKDLEFFLYVTEFAGDTPALH
ncbi:hypothetical protein KGQ34_00525 [Patescibacteria group bacterium]|nr:hypothetical protein [Patescibacteria group bacterium]